MVRNHLKLDSNRLSPWIDHEPEDASKISLLQTDHTLVYIHERLIHGHLAPGGWRSIKTNRPHTCINPFQCTFA